ncbi:MAG TPA: hypothetical protein VM912_22150 [Terriglobales bacterium]|nr:hypothetical protein [Terriglobales bacterium]
MSTDNDLKKGAVETEERSQHSQSSMGGQLPHRPENAWIQGNDTDFPEPGENPEHSGQETDSKVRLFA